MGFLFLYIGKLFQLYRKISCIFFNNFFPCIFLYLFLEFLPIKLWTPWCDHLIFTFSILLSTYVFFFSFMADFQDFSLLLKIYFQYIFSLQVLFLYVLFHFLEQCGRQGLSSTVSYLEFHLVLLFCSPFLNTVLAWYTGVCFPLILFNWILVSSVPLCILGKKGCPWMCRIRGYLGV